MFHIGATNATIFRLLSCLSRFWNNRDQRLTATHWNVLHVLMYYFCCFCNSYCWKPSCRKIRPWDLDRLRDEPRQNIRGLVHIKLPFSARSHQALRIVGTFDLFWFEIKVPSLQMQLATRICSCISDFYSGLAQHWSQRYCAYQAVHSSSRFF